jgi:hypothetical protein
MSRRFLHCAFFANVWSASQMAIISVEVAAKGDQDQALLCVVLGAANVVVAALVSNRLTSAEKT